MNKNSRRKAPRRLGILLGVALTPLILLVAVLIGFGPAGASSHREAPAISMDPYADNTDTYVYIPQGVTDRIVLVANYIPNEGPEGGPYYNEFDDHVYYDIHVDMDGDAVSEVTYTLSSRVEVGNPDTFLYNVNTIDNLADPDWNRRQYYTVTEYFEPGSHPMGQGQAPDAHVTYVVSDVLATPANIGSKSTPNWEALRDEATRTYTDPDNGDEIQVYAGFADDPFWVDLQIFDLLTLRGQAPPIGYAVGNNDPIDSLSGLNVHTLVLEVPMSRLVRDEPILGVWAAARRANLDVLGGGSGEYVQVSRLGMPLVNEVVLPLSLKDTFNSIPPSADLSVYSLLQESVEDPEVGNLLCGLYGVPLPEDGDDCETEYNSAVPGSGRGDIFQIYITGIVLTNPYTITTATGPMVLPAGFNVNQPVGVVPAEMIRINTTISGDLCSPTPSPLGILGGDACGFPNGRRLTDEVIEISLLAVAGAAYEVIDDEDDSFTFDPAFIAVLDDGVDGNDVPFKATFPYVGLAQSGQEHIHENPLDSMTSVALATLSGVSLTGNPLLEISLLLMVAAAGLCVWLLRRRTHAANH